MRAFTQDRSFSANVDHRSMISDDRSLLWQAHAFEQVDVARVGAIGLLENIVGAVLLASG
jgi:hypothetical protein